VIFILLRDAYNIIKLFACWGSLFKLTADPLHKLIWT